MSSEAPGTLGAAARRRRRAIKATVFSLAAVPLLWLGWQAARGDLGANPIAEAMNRLGYWALVCLLASLACTPAQRWLGFAWAVGVRRMLGLFAFTYASLHVAVYLGLDQFFDLGAILADIVKRPFITVGTLAFLILLPLAVTSTRGMVKRLGFPRWKRLHRLVYLAASAAAVHFFWRVKSDHREPLIFAAVVVVLLGARVGRARTRRPLGSSSSPSPAPAPARSSPLPRP